ncbi:hypothetical protein ATANTOWER_001819 [Ataeniobius toweri]|uniref:Uncharacterized protein n=1 Tax=Ataeniobius toweri TaxID=208326 RepID=A0ABU7AWH9_9TELE|nr:hypothetical protein [Ataeniobius toweri]
MACKMDSAATFNRRRIEGGAKRKKEIKIALLPIKKNPIIIPNQHRKDTKSPLTQWIGSPDQNNYCIISSSDNPWIDPALICMQNWVRGYSQDVPIASAREREADSAGRTKNCLNG